MYKAWGTTVAGVDQGDGWLKVGDQYLPMSINGTQVLTRKAAGAACKAAEDFKKHVLEVGGEEEKQLNVRSELQEELLPCPGCCCRMEGPERISDFAAPDAPRLGVAPGRAAAHLVSRFSL